MLVKLGHLCKFAEGILRAAQQGVDQGSMGLADLGQRVCALQAAPAICQVEVFNHLKSQVQQ